MASLEKKDHLLVVGFTGCGYFERAVESAEAAPNVELTAKELPTRDAFREYLSQPSVAEKIGTHKSSPAVFLYDDKVPVVDSGDIVIPPSTSTFLGGCDDLLKWLKADPPNQESETLSPDALLELFHKKQREHSFVLWVLFRGLW